MIKPEEMAPAAARLPALAAADGSGTSAHPRALATPGVPARDLADAVHFICALHARHPGVIGQAMGRVAAPPHWLGAAELGFAAERAYLARLVAAAGPIPSTPGHAESEAAVAVQRHAIETLSCSDRVGCALGAAAALVLDWPVIRTVLDTAALRFGVEPFATAVPVADTLAADFGNHERAALFAAQQLFAQHRGLWQLLEARAAARR